MSTLVQTIFKKKKKIFTKANKLYKNPQKKVTVRKFFIKHPKKPNSARRVILFTKFRFLKKYLISTNKILARITRESKSAPKKHARVLIRGGRANDIPGINLTAIRGILGFSTLNIKKKRSKYGKKRPSKHTLYVRKKYKKLFI